MYLDSVTRIPVMALAACLAIASSHANAQDDPIDMPEHVVGEQSYPFPMADPRDEKPPAIELPDGVAPKLALLTPEDIAFLESSDARSWAGGLEETVEALEERTPEEVREWVHAIRGVAFADVYVEGRDLTHVPFNTASPTFNAWRLRRPRSMDPPREAGAVPLGRYGGGGPPTFGNYPLALTIEDLEAAEADVAIVGAPLNMGSGWRDSGRQATTDLRMWGRTLRGSDQYALLYAASELTVVDYGDIAVDNENTERAMQHVREVVREIAQTGAIPMIVGGDHSLEYPNVAALADVYGKENVSVIHFDSHYDAWWGDEPHLINHGYPVYRLINEGHVRGADYIQVGLRSGGLGKAAFKWMREIGMRYHNMAEVELRGWDAIIERVVAEASEEGRKIHISFDIDVLDPAYTVATGTPVPGGINMREAITIVRRLCAESNVVGFDLVELHPALDPTYKTTLNSAHIMKACLVGLAMNRKGLTDPHYLSPLSSEHALDDYYGDQQEYLDRTQAEEEAEEDDKE